MHRPKAQGNLPGSKAILLKSCEYSPLLAITVVTSVTPTNLIILHHGFLCHQLVNADLFAAQQGRSDSSQEGGFLFGLAVPEIPTYRNESRLSYRHLDGMQPTLD